MERGLDEASAPISLRIHAPGGCSDERQPLIVFVENQNKIGDRKAVLGAEAVDPLNRLQEDPQVELVKTLS